MVVLCRPGWITRGAYYGFGEAGTVRMKEESHVIFMRLFRTICIAWRGMQIIATGPGGSAQGGSRYGGFFAVYTCNDGSECLTCRLPLSTSGKTKAPAHIEPMRSELRVDV